MRVRIPPGPYYTAMVKVKATTTDVLSVTDFKVGEMFRINERAFKPYEVWQIIEIKDNRLRCVERREIKSGGNPEGWRVWNVTDRILHYYSALGHIERMTELEADSIKGYPKW